MSKQNFKVEKAKLRRQLDLVKKTSPDRSRRRLNDSGEASGKPAFLDGLFSLGFGKEDVLPG
jgi:hypothetical protein